MSFLTEYFDEYRQHPIRKTKICRPEDRWAKLEGKWLDPKQRGDQDKVWSEEEIDAFITNTMKSVRGQSTYYNEYCAHLDPACKTRPFIPRIKKLPLCKDLDSSKKQEEEEAPPPKPTAKLAMKDTELMKMAHDMYERDMNKPTLEPLPTHFRMLGYVRPCLFKTGLTDYQDSIAKLAYELIRDNRIPKYHAHNGNRPKWGYPPDEARQPELDGVPFESESLF